VTQYKTGGVTGVDVGNPPRERIHPREDGGGIWLPSRLAKEGLRHAAGDRVGIPGHRRVDAKQRRERRLHHGRWNSLARHVAEDQEHGAFGCRHEVVEVAADLASRFHARGPTVAGRRRRDLGKQRLLDFSRQPEVLILDDAGPIRIQQLCAGGPEVKEEVGQRRDGDRGNHVTDPLEFVPRRSDGRDDPRFGLRAHHQNERAHGRGHGNDSLSRHRARPRGRRLVCRCSVGIGSGFHGLLRRTGFRQDKGSERRQRHSSRTAVLV
jgi:hypothetical protein